jgi:hypothetical protein
MAIQLNPVGGDSDGGLLAGATGLPDGSDPLVLSPAQVESLPWVAVDSTNIARVAYRGSDLFIQFNSGSLYRYQDVPSGTATRLVEANSVGSMFNKIIKDRHGYTQAIIREEATPDVEDVDDLNKRVADLEKAVELLDKRVSNMEKA